MIRVAALASIIAVIGLTANHAQATRPAAERELSTLHEAYLAKYRPLELKASSAWWEANITGSDAAVAREKAANRALVDLHSDPITFAKLKELRAGGQIADPMLRRIADVLYRQFLAGQADPALQKRIVDLESEVARTFNTYRSRVGERTLTENEVREILATTKDSQAAEAAWQGYMVVGSKVDVQLRELVKLRNELAGKLGFKNFYSMSLALQELDEEPFFKLFDGLDEMTRAPFAELKAEIDQARAAHFGVKPEELRPWHFGDLFFQDIPPGQEVDFGVLFKDADLEQLARQYYASIGLPVDDILARSDLYEKPGKCPHAFCSNLDRGNDIRVLANLKPNLYQADTILHELGHGVYGKYNRADVPFVLRGAAHGLTTEGIAIMMGAMCKNEEWLREVLKVDPQQAAQIGRSARAGLRTERLMFARWALVMVHFEHEMYTQPDQDLARLWWNLKRKYQLLNPPPHTDRPDYAAKVHILTSPVYYHSYMMGELFAAQVRHHIARQVLGLKESGRTSFYGHPEVGTYLKEQVFGPGNLYSWNDLTRRATGESLTAQYFAEQLQERE